jgi:hypothetical protein
LIKGISFFKIHENGSENESTEEIEKQIELLKEMLLKRKGNGSEKESNAKKSRNEKKKSKNGLMNQIKDSVSSKKGIDLLLTDDKDKEFEKF